VLIALAVAGLLVFAAAQIWRRRIDQRIFDRWHEIAPKLNAAAGPLRQLDPTVSDEPTQQLRAMKRVANIAGLLGLGISGVAIFMIAV
jgi:predicted amidophosphoribosyltransferase